MKVHPCAHGFWDHHQSHETRTLLFGCNLLHSLAPKLVTTRDCIKHFKSEVFDLKSFVRSEKIDHVRKQSTIQVETQAGGTRWNPMQEQIGILELLYQGGMRTPNVQQIEQITQQLSKYGKIEGKNVFYWFQNNKARERQKKKRSILGLNHLTIKPPLTSPVNTSIALTLDAMVDVESHNQSAYKRKCMSRTFESFEENNMKCNYIDDKDKTLELFPLHPEGR